MLGPGALVYCCYVFDHSAPLLLWYMLHAGLKTLVNMPVLLAVRCTLMQWCMLCQHMELWLQRQGLGYMVVVTQLWH